jgi:hypothetical protein
VLVAARRALKSGPLTGEEKDNSKLATDVVSILFLLAKIGALPKV